MLRNMFMIFAAATDADTPTGLLIFLGVMGAVALIMGVRWAFNWRGAVDSTLQRRRAVLELKGQRSGDLGLAGNDSIGPWFFRIIGSIVAVAGLGLLTLSSILFASA
ncbi:hypothetical protein P3L51_00865 [Streptomyces sp. PSRA5]|uniref:hypothetical protein n=1 Tax=Streptomyces panacea TaxID=3035064 RepID=UPI00339C3B33